MTNNLLKTSERLVVVVDVGLLSANHQKINLIVGEDLLLNAGVVPFCRSLLTPPR